MSSPTEVKLDFYWADLWVALSFENPKLLKEKGMSRWQAVAVESSVLHRMVEMYNNGDGHGQVSELLVSHVPSIRSLLHYGLALAAPGSRFWKSHSFGGYSQKLSIKVSLTRLGRMCTYSHFPLLHLYPPIKRSYILSFNIVSILG